MPKIPAIAYPIADNIKVVFKQNKTGTLRWFLVTDVGEYNLSPTDALTMLTSAIEPVVE
jgi:hypothetical protein